MLGDIRAPNTTAGSPSPVILVLPLEITATSSNVSVILRKSRKSGPDNGPQHDSIGLAMENIGQSVGVIVRQGIQGIRP